MEVQFMQKYNTQVKYYYTMKIENNICTWSCNRWDWEVHQYKHYNNPSYNVPKYIPKSIKQLIELVAFASNGFTICGFDNKIKDVLTVTLKNELDDIILHHVKELKETEIKLKESDNKLKKTKNKLKKLVDKFELLQNTYNDLIINNNNDKNNYTISFSSIITFISLFSNFMVFFLNYHKIYSYKG